MWRHIDEKVTEYHGRLLKRISELEGQVAYEQERNQLNVAQHTDRIKELEAELAMKEKQADAYEEIVEGDLLTAKKRISELETELATASEAFAVKDIDRHNRIKELEADIQAYRGALGYAVPSKFKSQLSGGTIPSCGMCDANYKRADWLEAELSRIKERK